jgi:hypothetical protein
LEQDPSDSHTVSKHLLSIVQSAIRKSWTLRQNIKDYFDKLKITLENMNEVCLVLSSIQKSEILSYICKTTVLQTSFTEDASTEYYVKWFQCFLAKSQLWNNTERNQRKKLFEDWAKYTMDKYANIIFVLSMIDNLLDAINDSVDNDWFRTYFINYVINLCFKQSK